MLLGGARASVLAAAVLLCSVGPARAFKWLGSAAVDTDPVVMVVYQKPNQGTGYAGTYILRKVC